MKSNTDLFAAATRSLTRRGFLGTAAVAATPGLVAVGSVVNPKHGVPSDVATLATEWASLVDKVCGRPDKRLDGETALDTYEILDLAHSRLRAAMRETGIVALVVEGKLIVDSWEAENVNDCPEFGVVVIELADVRGF